MTDDNHDAYDDPVILRPGVTCPRGTFELTSQLLAAGHRITVTDRGDVMIWPPVHEDLLWSLDSHASETAKVLAACGLGTTTH